LAETQTVKKIKATENFEALSDEDNNPEQVVTTHVVKKKKKLVKFK
jgi:hypothetical protein